MFGLKKKGPDPAVHTCRRLPEREGRPRRRDPVELRGGGLWKAECVCTAEYFREPITDDRSTRRPHVISGSASTSPRPIPR